jgi:hypothetical protein
MSWSFEFMGSKQGVLAKVAEKMDDLAKSYAGKPEADDVEMCKARIIALVEACDLDDITMSKGFNAVKVSAGGSHYAITNSKIGSANFKVEVTRIQLAF